MTVRPNMVDPDKIHRVHEVFATEGGLFKFLPGYRRRDVQVHVAVAVADAIANRQTVLLEAGTGTGKTLAYLAGLIEVGGKTIVSTGTKALQDQLWYKDIPLLAQLYPGALRFALLKGRSNYLCPDRLEKQLMDRGRETKPRDQHELVKVREWSARTATGDLNELEGEVSQVTLVRVTSTRDNCLGRLCSKLSECPLYHARERAHDADVLIVNHHLLLTDLLMNDEPNGNLLPQPDTIIVDEAHQLPKIAGQFLGAQFSSAKVRDLCFDLVREPELKDTVISRHTIEILRQLDLIDQFVAREAVSMSALIDSTASLLDDFDLMLGDVVSLLRTASGRGRATLHLLQRMQHLVDELAVIIEAAGTSETATWAERSTRGFVFRSAPGNPQDELAAFFADSSATWLFLSATLTVSGSFAHVQQSLGLQHVPGLTFPSPFAYRENVLGWIPQLLFKPGTSEHTAELVDSLQPLLGGKALLLFTSHRALRQATSMLREKFPVFPQGEMAKHELIARFTAADNGILLATMSFWEGVDLRGAGVRILVVDKLPFGNPDDPASSLAARQSADYFEQHLLPQAIIMLRQGFGRLVRQEEDTGIFVLGDHRVTSRSYGAEVINSLPDIEWAEEVSDVVEFLNR